MRIIEQEGQAWKALLKQADKGAVICYGRGIDSKERSLYEVTDKKGEVICKGTEHEIMDALRKDKEE
jgi:hypothetical protein